MPKPGNNNGPCFVCGTNIHILQFECGHVVSHSNGGPTNVENLRPVCSSCNKSMGTQNLQDYKKNFFSRSEPRKSSIDEITLGVLKLSILPPVPTLRMNSSPWVGGCQHILIKGKRKGQKCGRKVHKNMYCRSHLSSHHSE